MSDFEILNDEIRELTPSELSAEKDVEAAEYNKCLDLDEAKARRVSQFILANPNYPVRALVSKFNMDWALVRDFGNGIGKVQFSVGDAAAMELNLVIADWFRS
jgi:hypothetical protein